MVRRHHLLQGLLALHVWFMGMPTPASAAPPPGGWSRYVIPESGASVHFPGSIFVEDAGPTLSGAGRRFRTADGSASLSIYQKPNDANDTPASFMRKNVQVPASQMLYRRVSGDFLAVSGVRADKIIYERCNFSRKFITCVLLDYPAAEKRRWDYAVTRISRSLDVPAN